VTVREHAMSFGLKNRISRAWSVCEDLALDPAQPSFMASQLYAALGGSMHHARMVPLLRAPRARRSVLRAIGYAGDVDSIDTLLRELDAADAREVKVAVQSLALIVGFLPYAAPYVAPEPPRARCMASAADDAKRSLPPLEVDELDADLVPWPEEALPPPNVGAIAALCAARVRECRGTRRLLFGAPFDAARLATLLESCPLGWRHTLAVSAFLRSDSDTRVDTRALSRRQAMQMRTLGSWPLREMFRW